MAETELISRQNALDAIEHYIDEVGNIPMGTAFKEGVKDVYYRTISIIKGLPSAEPQIIRCKDCKHFSRTLFLGSGYNCGECHRDTAMRPGVGDVMRPDDYCSRAERSEEE